MPASFSSRATSSSKATTFELSWDDGDHLRQHQQADKDLHIQTEVAAALTPGTTDPLSAVFRLGEMGAEGPCRAVQRVSADRTSTTFASAIEDR